AEGHFKTPGFRAEWSTFADREKSCGGVALLIYPILHSGMRALPAEALERQLADFRQWNFPYPQFRQNQRYLSFHRAIETVADELAQRCSQAPEWTQNWPVHAPRNPSARTGLDTWSLPKWQADDPSPRLQLPMLLPMVRQGDRRQHQLLLDRADVSADRCRGR